MGDANSKRDNLQNDEITLGLLSAVEEDSHITQRSIASELSIALGLTNAYLRKCVDKGLVKVQHVPKKRYIYFLTPRGFAEKARLTAEYFKSSFDFFRKSRENCEALIIKCTKRRFKRIILSDISEIAEVAILSCLGTEVKIVGIIGNLDKDFSGIPIYKNFKEAPKFDAIFFTALNEPHKKYDELLKIFKKSQILVPDLLLIRLENMNQDWFQIFTI